MTELMWAAVKEPLETHFQFDKEGLDLAFKYFTCSTLTIRLAGIAQINVRLILVILVLYRFKISQACLCVNIPLVLKSCHTY